MYLAVHTLFFFLIMPSRPPRMAPSPGHSGVRRISGRIPDSTVQVRVGTHGSSNGPTHDPTPQDRLSSLTTDLTTTIFFCFCCCSPNATNFPSFEYLTSCHESLLTSHPCTEVLYIGDFNVHHTDWLKSTHTDVGGIEAFHFSISN